MLALQSTSVERVEKRAHLVGFSILTNLVRLVPLRTFRKGGLSQLKFESSHCTMRHISEQEH